MPVAAEAAEPSALGDPQPATLILALTALLASGEDVCRADAGSQQPVAEPQQQQQQTRGEIHRGQQHEDTAGGCISADGHTENSGQRRAVLAQRHRQPHSSGGRHSQHPGHLHRPPQVHTKPTLPPLSPGEQGTVQNPRQKLCTPKTLIHPLLLPPKAELQPSPPAKDNTVGKGMLFCAPSYLRKSHFYLSKTTFPFYHQHKKDHPHLSALHNPAAASKVMSAWEKRHFMPTF